MLNEISEDQKVKLYTMAKVVLAEGGLDYVKKALPETLLLSNAIRYFSSKGYKVKEWKKLEPDEKDPKSVSEAQ